MASFLVTVEFTTEAEDPHHAARVVIDMLRTASIDDDEDTDWRMAGEPTELAAPSN